MFIRIKRVKLSDRYTLTPPYSLHLVLVKSFRLKGKPRQRVVKYLGSIREQEFRNASLRHLFLEMIQKKIDQLNLDPRKAAQLKVSLIKKSIRFGRPF